MAKKPRSQRRKKGSGSALRNDGGGEDGGGDVEVLPDDHTIADSVSTLHSFDEEFVDHGDEIDPDETGSGSHVTRAAASAATRQVRLLDSLSLASDIPAEKRATKREAHFRRLFKSITQHATGDTGREAVLSKLEESLLPACVAGLRGGVASPAEQYAACRVLEATGVVLGGDNDEYAEAVDPHLRKIVLATGRAPQVRGAALRALAMSHFICGTDDAGTNSVLDLCEGVCGVKYRGEEVSPTLRATALDCWALLSTTVHDAYIAGDEVVAGGDGGGNGRGVVILPLLADCLNHPSVELRSAAGECVALIHESRLNLGIDDDELNATERRFRRGSWDGSEWEVLMDEVKQRIAELSVESGHRMSKKAKKEQRATFREFMSTIVDDEAPSEVVSFRGGSLTLGSWREVVQLNFARHCLQGGFQIQLMTNGTLHALFGVDESILNSAGGQRSLSQLEKRLIMSKTSEAAKSADRDMAKRRRNRTNVKNHFLTADGDDI